MRWKRRTKIALIACMVAHAWGAAQAQETPPEPDEDRNVAIPQQDLGAESLRLRAADQWRTARSSGVDIGFALTDRIGESGIAWSHEIVDDAGKDYKPVHYDHGNGIAAADVDGDGRIDLYLTTQLGANALLKNQGGGRFTDITTAAGVALGDRVSVTASFADVDNDGDPDLFVTTVRMGNTLFENLGGGRFRDVTAAAGLTHSGHSSGAVFFDFNRDGRLDLFVSNVGQYTHDERGRGGYFIGFEDAFTGHLTPDRAERSLLYKNLGGLRFEEVSHAVGLDDTSWTGDATATDLDADGFPELYVLNMQGDDHYWINQAGKRFVDGTAERFPKTPWGAMGVKFFDQNNDGRLDLVISDMHSDMSQPVPLSEQKAKSDIQWDDDYLQGGANNVFGNAFYRAQADGSFVEMSDSLNLENYWPWGLSVGDLNADGFEDVFMTLSMNYPYQYQPNAMLLNNGGKRFVDAEFVLGIEPRLGGETRKPWFDVDCSGADKDMPFCQDREGVFTYTGALGSRSSVFLDLDDDGDLDLVTNEFHAPPQVLISDLAARRKVNHLTIDLVGSRSNRDGLGAWVTVHAGDRAFTRYHDGKSGYLSQSDLPLYIGLGKATAVDRVEVRWPSGTRQTVAEPAIGKLLTIREPQPKSDR